MNILSFQSLYDAYHNSHLPPPPLVPLSAMDQFCKRRHVVGSMSAFQRDHQRLLQSNGWNNLSQEILISTPRRFGKTISVSLFAAAILYSAPRVELSIYSTCKRISQKLLRNIKKFLDLLYTELGMQPYRVVRRCVYPFVFVDDFISINSISAHHTSNCEELVIQGPESKQDLRQVNSYPSKVISPLSSHSVTLHHQGFLQVRQVVSVKMKELTHPIH